jgi:hypothetical protein
VSKSGRRRFESCLGHDSSLRYLRLVASLQCLLLHRSHALRGAGVLGAVARSSKACPVGLARQCTASCGSDGLLDAYRAAAKHGRPKAVLCWGGWPGSWWWVHSWRFGSRPARTKRLLSCVGGDDTGQCPASPVSPVSVTALPRARMPWQSGRPLDCESRAGIDQCTFFPFSTVPYSEQNPPRSWKKPRRDPWLTHGNTAALP